MPSISNTFTVYHGTNLFSAKIILDFGIMLNAQRELTDFGKGFYVTPHLKQASQWAWVKARNPQISPIMLETLKMSKQQYLDHPDTRVPALLAFKLDMNQLLQLNGVIFPTPSEPLWLQYKESWKFFVQNCRRGIKHHYDFVYGPIGKSHTGNYLYVRPSKLKLQLSLNSDKALQCLSLLKITPLTFKRLETTMKIHQNTHLRHVIDSNPIHHPFVKEIRNHLMNMKQCSFQYANDLIKNSWISALIHQQSPLLLQESPAYWAFIILYGNEELWYLDYENYLIQNRNDPK